MRFPLTSSSARPGGKTKVEENGEGKQSPGKKIWSVFESQAMLAGCTAAAFLESFKVLWKQAAACIVMIAFLKAFAITGNDEVYGCAAAWARSSLFGCWEVFGCDDQGECCCWGRACARRAWPFWLP